MRFRIGLLAVFVVVLVGCKPDPVTGPSLTQVEPNEVLGTVWGNVFDAATQTPLEGASVVLQIGTDQMTRSTNADGHFSFDLVPAGGEAGLTISAAGYTTATLRDTIPGSNGDFPTCCIGPFVGPIALFATTGSFEVQLVGYDATAIDGASGFATVMADHVNLGSFAGPTGLSTASATSAGGLISFTGLPDLNALATYGMSVTVTISPVDLNGDGIVEYLGKSDTRSASWIVNHGGRYTLTLAPPGETFALTAIATNVGSLLGGGRPQPGDSVIGLNGPMRIVYNQPIAPATLLASVFGREGKNLLGSSTTVEQGNVVVISPDSPFTEGREYHLLVEVLAAGTSSSSNRSRLSGSFFSAPPNDEISVGLSYTIYDLDGNNELGPNDLVILELSQAIGLGNGNGGWFPLYFNVDLDASNAIGDFPGEWGHEQPVVASATEPSPNSPFVRSGFTQCFKYFMPPGPIVPYSYSVNSNVPYVMNFGGSEAGYQRLVDPRGLPIATPSASAGETLTVSFSPDPPPASGCP